MNSWRTKSWFQRKRTVSDDWLARLPEEKRKLFDETTAELEASYAMMSVALDDAIALRSQGRLVRARAQAANSSALLERLAAQLLGALGAIREHGRHLGNLPIVEPLDGEFFRGETAQRIAGWNNLLHRVLLSSNARFFHKLNSLAEAVEEVTDEFRDSATDIAEGTCVFPGTYWGLLECLHYDLNTCLRETVVVLKSFICALPMEQIATFQRKLETPEKWLERRVRAKYARALA